MARILCLDYGERRTGVAISDETKTIAQSLTTISHQSEPELLAAIAPLIKKYDVDRVVIGLPLSLSGKPSTRSEKIRTFAERVKKRLRIPVELYDERLTTVSAQQVLQKHHKRKSGSTAAREKSPLDRIAATIILENYLATLKRKKDD